MPPAIVPSGYVCAARRRATVVASVIGFQCFEKEATAVMCQLSEQRREIDEASDSDNRSDGSRCASLRSILLRSLVGEWFKAAALGEFDNVYALQT